MSEEKKLSVSDFKNWLSGVLDFQEDDWTPNLDQWKKILSKIEELEEAPARFITEEPPSPPSKKENNTVTVARHPRPEMDKSILPKTLDGPSVKLPDAPVIKRNKGTEVHQQSEPSVEQEGGRRVIHTGKIHKTKENQDANYESDFI